MLENLLVGIAFCVILIGSGLLVRSRRKMRLARQRREHLLSLIGLQERTSAQSAADARRWRERFRTRQASL